MKKKSAKKPARKKLSIVDLKKFSGGRPANCWQGNTIELCEKAGMSEPAAEKFCKANHIS